MTHWQDIAPRAATVQKLATAQGFALVGIAPAEPTAYAEALRRWLADGKQGEMQYLADAVDVRVDPRQLVEGARSVICVADGYGGRHEGTEARRHEGAERGGGAERQSNGKTQRETQRRSEDMVDRRSRQHHEATRLAAPQASDEANANQTSEIRNQKFAPGRVARYAWGDDYHRVIKKRLHALADAMRERWPGHEFRSCVDTAPLLEREHAARAGLGWVGKHTLLIHPQLGSWLLLGEIVTTLAIQSSGEAGYPQPTVPPTDHCGTCTRCIDACPTGCIAKDGYSLDASRCISYLTIEHRGVIDASLHSAMGDWVAGCDVCQEVCPFNGDGGWHGGDGGWRMADGGWEDECGDEAAQRRSGEGAGPLPHEAKRLAARGQGNDGGRANEKSEIRNQKFPLLVLLNWTAEDRRRAFAGSALKRIKLNMLKRNALIAAGNHLAQRPDAALRQRIADLAEDADEDELVRATARQVLRELPGGVM